MEGSIGGTARLFTRPWQRLLQVFHEKQVRQVAGVSEDVVLLVSCDSTDRGALKLLFSPTQP